MCYVYIPVHESLVLKVGFCTMHGKYNIKIVFSKSCSIRRGTILHILLCLLMQAFCPKWRQKVVLERMQISVRVNYLTFRRL